MPLLVKEQRSGEWFKEHLNRITSSTAAGCLGYGKHGMSSIRAWKKIKGLLKDEDNWYKQYGLRNESRALDAYEKETGLLMAPTGFWVHPTMKWLGASPDGLGAEGALEIKCPQTLPTEPHKADVTQAYVVALVTDRPWCDLFYWTSNGTFLHRVLRNKPFEEWLLFQLAVFYRDYVVANVQPPRRKPKRKPKIDVEDVVLKD